MWKKKNLTLFGKATVVNTIAIPGLVYNFTLLHVPEWVIDRLEKAIRNFLWNSKDRININCIIAKVEEGGINLVDVRTKIGSLKASWVSKWISSKQLACVNSLCMYLKRINVTLDMVLNFNIQNIQLITIFKDMPIFYQDVLLNYYKCKTLKCITKMNYYDYFTSCIWGNNNLMINGKCVFYKNWIKSDILHIKDLFDNSGCFLSEQHIKNLLCNKTNWMIEYLTIKQLVMKHIRKYHFDTSKINYINIKENICQQMLVGKLLINVSDIKSKTFYELLIKNKISPHYMRRRWCCKFNISVSYNEWSDIYIRKVKNVIHKKLAEFNFKIINGVLSNGYIVNKWNKSVSGVCQICKENDTSEHMLFLCPRINKLWSSISEIIKFKIKWKHLVLGLHENNYSNIAKNNILTIISYSIYSNWIKCNQPDCNLNFFSIDIVKHVIPLLSY